ncbi:hypothetical protein [Spongiactinospora sp. TRM90649]|uniref:hypothetical protein n=1 Tax=Spongiactinospora sp. TRM90649 TaxID=3031114 RepID=UPI0023F9691A|nr:hypothetical protein [Spongiactinospora sp. TRM90649]MDF5756198.1 hypothetical protein [Spongiactinospora sp. TRM90649]
MRRTLFAGAALLLATGCGTTGTPGVSPAQEHDQIIKYVQCLRQHGVEAPDPPPGENSLRIKAGSPEKGQAAQEACKQHAPKTGGGPNNADDDEDMLELARCLRERGLDVADPQPGKGVRIPDGDRNEQLVQACTREAE